METKLRSPLPAAPSAWLGLTEKEKAGFDLIELCKSVDRGTGVEKFMPNLTTESTRDILASAAMLCSPRHGQYAMPADLTGVGGQARRIRGASMVEPSGGGFLEASPHKGLVVDALRPHSKVLRLADHIDNAPPGEVLIGRLDEGATGVWVDEDEEAGPSDQKVGLLRARPRIVSANAYVSRSLMRHAVPGSSERLQQDLMRGLAQTAEQGFITGIGGRIQPLGLLNWDGIGEVVGGEDGLAPAWSHVIGLESRLTTANADTSRAAYLTNGVMRSTLRQTPRHTTAHVGDWVWEPHPSGTDPSVGVIAGYPAHVSNQVPSNLSKGSSDGICSAIIFANWEDVVVVSWGPIELTVDPYTKSKSGGVVVTAFWDVDLVVLRPEAVAVMRDALSID